MVGVAALADDDDMAAFVAEFGLEGMTTIVDDDGAVWARFGVRVQPAWAFVSADGGAEVVFGALESDAITARLAALEGQQ